MVLPTRAVKKAKGRDPNGLLPPCFPLPAREKGPCIAPAIHHALSWPYKQSGAYISGPHTHPWHCCRDPHHPQLVPFSSGQLLRGRTDGRGNKGPD